jgi:hypothetical protein
MRGRHSWRRPILRKKCLFAGDFDTHILRIGLDHTISTRPTPATHRAPATVPQWAQDIGELCKNQYTQQDLDD